MPGRSAFEYTVVRAVPDVTREEFINVGVILYCREHRFLAARVHLDGARLAALFPGLSDPDLAGLAEHLETIPCICAGGPGSGPIGELPQAERFRWLASPRNTMLQVSPVHSGLCTDPAAALEDLFRRSVC
jgi:hypothetical protein